MKMPVVSDKVVYAEFGGESVAVDLGTGGCYRLDPVATFIVLLCDPSRSEVPVPKEAVRVAGRGNCRSTRSFDETLEELIDLGLLVDGGN